MGEDTRQGLQNTHYLPAKGQGYPTESKMAMIWMLTSCC